MTVHASDSWAASGTSHPRMLHLTPGRTKSNSSARIGAPPATTPGPHLQHDFRDAAELDLQQHALIRVVPRLRVGLPVLHLLLCEREVHREDRLDERVPPPLRGAPERLQLLLCGRRERRPPPLRLLLVPVLHRSSATLSPPRRRRLAPQAPTAQRQHNAERRCALPRPPRNRRLPPI